MFKVHQTTSDLLVEDCRAGSAGWIRISQGSPRADGSSVDIEEIPPPLDDDKEDPPQPQGDASPSSTASTASTGSTISPSSNHTFTPIHAIYGVYSLLSGSYLAVIKDARVIASGPNSEKIYCILDVEMMPVSAASHKSFFKHASKREKKDELAYIAMIKGLLASKTFYFAYDYDLTLSAQRKAINSPSNPKVPMWQKADEDFFWNKPVMQRFIECHLDKWIIPVISGFVKVMKKCDINGSRCDLLFFTRRSCRRVGTRFNVRGVDKDGNVANFAETEMMIVKPNRSICSYVQIRGSIPLYWDQLVTLKYMPRTRYAYSGNESVVDWNELAFRAHMDNIIQRYGHITVVNLIDRIGKSSIVRDQAQLGSAFAKYVKKYNQQSQESVMGPLAGGLLLSSGSSNNLNIQTASSPSSKSRVSSSGNLPASPVSPSSTGGGGSSASSASGATTAAAPATPGTTPTVASGGSSSSSSSQLFAEPIAYVWFDFHHECRKMKWENLSKLLAEVHEQFKQYGWFESDAEGRPLSRQKGVFRVNCMDNLDRTNVVMSLFARRCALMALGLFDDKQASNSKSSVLDSPYEAFELVFKNAWADNADYVSKMYAGTGALKTDFTRTGKRSLSGAIQDGVNSVTRYYLNNFSDGIRQDAYDLLVANYVPDKRDESPFSFQQQHAFLNFLMELVLGALVVVSASVSMRNNESISRRIYHGFVVYVIGVATVMYLVLKKGKFRTLGRHYVCKPSFCSSGYIKKKEH